MFYSQCLLSKKGTLGTIWVAAHCLKRVKKHQVAQTNISSSVEKILADEVPVVSYRVLGYLLLGVVRIYSKKVEYLFHDCRHVLVKIKNFAGKKKSNINIEAFCTPSLSITRPERLELDTFEFDREILEDGSGNNDRAKEDIMLADARRNEGSGYFVLDKFLGDDDAEHFGTCSTADTPVKDFLSDYSMGIDVVVSQSNNFTSSEASIEKFRGDNFLLAERLDPISPLEFVEEPNLDRQCGEEHETEIEEIEMCNAKNVGRDEEESPGTLKSFAEEQNMDVEHLRPAEEISTKTGKCPIIMKDRSLSITVDVTPPSKCPCDSGATTPGFMVVKTPAAREGARVSSPSDSGATTPAFMVVKTPAAREGARVSRKRKCLFDDIIVLPNKFVKESIDDSSDLVSKRKKAPHTPLQFWRAHKITNLPHTFLEPLFHCEFSLDLRPLSSKKKLKSSETIEPVEAPGKIEEIGSPSVQRPPDDTGIATSTPVRCSASLRSHDIWGSTNLDTVGPACSLETREEILCRNGDVEFDTSQANEVTNSGQGDNQETNEWSIETRTLARYLCRTFLKIKKQGGDVVVNLSQVLKCKAKSENARVFYEILALKTGGYVDVKQHAPYEDILILETPKLQESL